MRFCQVSKPFLTARMLIRRVIFSKLIASKWSSNKIQKDQNIVKFNPVSVACYFLVTNQKTELKNDNKNQKDSPVTEPSTKCWMALNFLWAVYVQYVCRAANLVRFQSIFFFSPKISFENFWDSWVKFIL